jgi:hypothetical protein
MQSAGCRRAPCVDLAFGEHVISLSLAGYRELRSSISIASAQPVDLSFSLVELDVIEPSPVRAAEAASALAQREPVAPAKLEYVASSSALELGGFVSLGAGVVALGAGIAFEVMRARTESGARAESVQTKFARDLETMGTQQTLARVFAGGGVVLAAVGGVSLGMAYTSSERKPEAAGVTVACLPSHCQGVLSGVF